MSDYPTPDEQIGDLARQIGVLQRECERLTGQLRLLTNPPWKGISPCDCRHRNRMFVCGGRGTGPDRSERHGVTVCDDCGEFHVFAQVNGEHIVVTFNLPTDELVEAAGRWNEYLKEPEEEGIEGDC